MKLPFGPYEGTELDEAPDATLRWLDYTFTTEPSKSLPPHLIDEYRMRNVALKQEARRVLTERRRNGVKVDEWISRCRSCRQEIVWLKTASDKNMPIDAKTFQRGDKTFDASRHMSHFATCPFAKKHRRSE